MIKLDNKYYIDTDTYNWTLCERSITEKGEEAIRAVSWFSSIEALLKGYKNKIKRNIEKCNTIDEYIKKLEDIEERFKQDIQSIQIDYKELATIVHKNKYERKKLK